MWRYYLKTLALPPAVNLLAMLLAFWLWRRHSWLASLLFVIGFGSLLALSLPGVAWELNRVHAVHGPIEPAEARAFGAGAIVVLGGDRYLGAAEYGSTDQPGAATLRRLEYGAYLHRLTGLPLLVSGGSPAGEKTPEAELMRDTLRAFYDVPVRWLEPYSLNTYENASFSAQILGLARISRIVLVTHASHMPRATALFEQHGLEVLAAPTGFWSPSNVDPVALWIPSAEALFASSTVLHEQLGMLWYAVRENLPEMPLPN